MQKKKVGSVEYHEAGSEYFAKRQLRRHARVWSLWALGVGAVISGHFSGWNFGIGVGGWGGLFWAAIIIGVMYVCLCFCLAEMSPALPHTGGAYSFARSAMGPWGGYVTGLAENIEYVLTPAVIVFFIGSYLGSIFGTPPGFQPVWWVLMYVVFVGLNVLGVELSFKVTLIVTLLALACLVGFWFSALPSGPSIRYVILSPGPAGSITIITKYPGSVDNRISASVQTTLSNLPRRILKLDIGVIRSRSQPPDSRSTLTRPAARLGVIKAMSSTCSKTIKPPIVETPQSIVRVVAARVSTIERTAQTATSLSSQWIRPNRRQRNSFTITGLKYHGMPGLRRCGSTKKTMRRKDRPRNERSSVMTPCGRDRSNRR